MAVWIDLPLAARLGILALFGLLLGSLANWAIERLAYFKSSASPWSPLPAGVTQRSLWTRLPIVGWWFRGEESPSQHQAARLRLEQMGYEVPSDWRPRCPFWLRPMCLEIFTTFALPWLYWHQVPTGSLLPEPISGLAAEAVNAQWFERMFWGHAVLLFLMTIATFIDFDEQLIPDTITVPGTLFALLWGTLSLQAFMPVPLFRQDVVGIVPCTFTAPEGMTSWWYSWRGLLIAWGLWSLWCFSLLHRVVILRRGLRKAARYFVKIMLRDPFSKWLLRIWLVGMLLVAGAWWWGDTHWEGLLTGLIGLATGGGTVWAVRLVASVAMGEEAMGFGDVTLMAMIGAFLGWQAVVAAFFIAPLTAIVIVVLTFLLTRQRAVPFGPYLCASSAITVLYWPTIWNEALLPAMLLGKVFLAILIGSLILMGVLLMIWRFIKQQMFAT